MRDRGETREMKRWEEGGIVRSTAATYSARKEGRKDGGEDDVFEFVDGIVDAEEVFGVTADGLKVEIGGAGSLN